MLHQKDWITIYEKELQIAIQNEDREAYYFFWHEWIKEKRRLHQAGVIKIKPIPDYAK